MGASVLETQPPGLSSVVDARGPIDRKAAELAVRDLLRALRHDVDGQHLVDTPRRVAEAYAELLTPQSFNPTAFTNEEGYDELVLAREIPFVSLCQHHLLPIGTRLFGWSEMSGTTRDRRRRCAETQSCSSRRTRGGRLQRCIAHVNR